MFCLQPSIKGKTIYPQEGPITQITGVERI